jgi:hypothetical protein
MNPQDVVLSLITLQGSDFCLWHETDPLAGRAMSVD